MSYPFTVLVAVSYAKAQSANDEAVHGAERPRWLRQQQQELRDLQNVFDDIVGDPSSASPEASKDALFSLLDLGCLFDYFSDFSRSNLFLEDADSLRSFK